jgi:two-component system, OmpR family, sensor histidine kinase MprB
VSLRVKIVIALVLLACFATIAIGAASYVSTSRELHGQIDQSLADAANGMLHETRPGGPSVFVVPLDQTQSTRPRNLEQVLVQAIDGTGNITASPPSGALPVDDSDRAMAQNDDQGAASWREVSIDGEPFRMVTIAGGGGQGAVQLARSLAEVESVLDSILHRTLLATALVTLLAIAIGWFVARQITKRITRLTGAAEEVAATGRLDVAVPVDGNDEAGRLGAAFNEMLAALATSKDAQQRLVQDAGHELRTPLTSLRTNVSVLRRYDSLPPDSRARLVDDLDGESRELTTLVNELVELATDRRIDEPVDDVALGTLVDQAAERVRRRTSRTIDVSRDDTIVRGRPGALARAISNMIENAAKFSDAGPIEVEQRAGRVEVRDRGPGIADADLPHVFDRFYRAADARSRPGSGLGLAIVRDVAEAHGGRVFASGREGGGACVGFEIPSE